MMDAQVQCGRRQAARRVSAKMAAVLAVALLLLCSSVQSSAEEVQATITQVKLSDSTSPTNDSATTAASITTTTDGSSDTHSAVLAAQGLGEEEAPLVLVDLARADQEKMSSMTAAPPKAVPVPSGFDMNELDDDAGTQSFAATQEEGRLVEGYPVLASSEDIANQPGYGVQTYDPSGGDSVAAYEDQQSFAATQEEGRLVEGYPVLASSEDIANQPGYGVQTYDPSGAAYGDQQSFSATQEEGRLVEGYPVLANSEDIANQPGYGVQTYDPSEGHSLAAYEGDQYPGDVSLSSNSTRPYRPMPAKLAPAEAWRTGRCTFYGGMDAAGTMSGACGYGNLYASGYGVFTAALSAKLFNNGMACGACYEIACSGKGKPCKAGSIVVTATNFCPPNPGQSPNSGGWCNPPNEHFDLSYPAFSRIADPTAGVVPLQFRRVPCRKLGGIRYTLNGNCNFNLVTITNVGGSGVVIEAYMKGDNMDWAPLSRNWGANWQCSRNYCGKSISIKIVTSDKKVSISKLAGKDWAFGKTYVGQQVQ